MLRADQIFGFQGSLSLYHGSVLAYSHCLWARRLQTSWAFSRQVSSNKPPTGHQRAQLQSLFQSLSTSNFLIPRLVCWHLPNSLFPSDQGRNWKVCAHLWVIFSGKYWHKGLLLRHRLRVCSSGSLESSEILPRRTICQDSFWLWLH